MNLPPEKYLGDGLYVSFDGYQFVLRAPRETGDHVVALEPSVLDAFNQYVGEIEDWIRQNHKMEDQ